MALHDTESPEARFAADGATFGTAPQSLGDFLSMGNWLERKLEPPEPLLGEIITNSTRMFIGGPTGLGKTHLGMALAAGMASGAGFLHWKASRACRVLYIDGEMARDLVRERLADLYRRTIAEAEAVAKEGRGKPSGIVAATLARNLTVLCVEDCEMLAERFPKLGTFAPLNTDDGQTFLLRLVDMLGGVDAIFIDNRMSTLSGSMAEEQPWTDTMPLVKALTRSRIAQVWFDHTGHDSGKLYGTKTKEWQFDAVALLTKAERPGLDIAFTMEFTKARRRTPSNRTDFETVTLAMVDDAWEAEGAESEWKVAGKRRPLSPRDRTALGFLHDLLLREGQPLPPVWGLAPDLLSVSLDRFKDECERRALSTSDDERNRRISINQAVSSLRLAGLLSIRDERVWAVSRKAQQNI
jgi:hypothetical protein